MSPTHLVVLCISQLVRNDTQQQGLAILLINGRRKQSITIATDACHLEILNTISVRGELAISTNCAYPTEGANTNTGAQWSTGKEELAIAHWSDIGHLPESAVLAGIGALEEDGAIVAPCRAVPFVQGAGSKIILAGANNDVFIAICLEIIRIAEVSREPAGSTVDNDRLIVPRYQRCILCLSLNNAGFGIVDRCIYYIGVSTIFVNTTTPATLDVERLTRIDGDGFLRPVVEILTGDMSPMQT